MSLAEDLDSLRKEVLKVKREFSVKLDKINDNLNKISDKYKDTEEDDVKRDIRLLKEEMDKMRGKKGWLKNKLDGVVDKLAKLE